MGDVRFSQNYLEWIDKLTREFMGYTKLALRKDFIYDLQLEEAARKHSNTMAITRKGPWYSPVEFRDGALEHNFSHSARTAEEALAHLATRFRGDCPCVQDLKYCKRIGVGIAVVDGNGFVDVYVTQRLKPW
ncbi:MAG: hypothetical protein Q8L29_02170 [archaeon]|nr:hypothetical protein [archaeon]